MWKKKPKPTRINAEGRECVYLFATLYLTGSYFQTPCLLPCIPFYVGKGLDFQPYSLR